MNRVMLMGRLGADPEMHETDNDVLIAKFNVATTERYKGEETTDWHRCVAFNQTAEIIEKYLGKGDGILLEGKIKTRTWEDKESGDTRYITEIIVQRFEFPIGGRTAEDKEDDREYEDRQRSKQRGGRTRNRDDRDAGTRRTRSSRKSRDDNPPPSSDFEDDIPF